MRLSQIIFLIVFLSIILSVDIYLNKWIKSLKIKYEKAIKYFLLIFFKILPALFISSFLLIPLIYAYVPAEEYMVYFHSITGTFFLVYLPKIALIFFIAFEMLVVYLIRIFNSLVRKKSTDLENIKKKLSFINKFGFLFATFFFFLIAYGIHCGKFDFIVREVEIKSDKIPESFEDFKIAHITDFHLGGFLGNEEQVDKIVELINSQNADLIVFTGDFVNNVSEEADKFIEPLKKLKAKMGVYSILGNHDYGDYIKWKSPEEKKENLRRLINQQESIGMDLLLNETVSIVVNSDTINIIGVENWGKPPFPQYGDLQKALENVDQKKFDILLSHDPTHWEAEVLGATEIDLTLSGHTHGAQFGLEVDNIRWSPVSLRYDQWGGLYEKNDQKLYVSTGIGFIGFPGRIGMPPEVVVYKLTRK
ncbi:MAG: metallophosphoesterase [Rhodothermaceae bacterium]